MNSNIQSNYNHGLFCGGNMLDTVYDPQTNVGDRTCLSKQLLCHSNPEPCSLQQASFFWLKAAAAYFPRPLTSICSTAPARSSLLPTQPHAVLVFVKLFHKHFISHSSFQDSVYKMKFKALGLTEKLKFYSCHTLPLVLYSHPQCFAGRFLQ